MMAVLAAGSVADIAIEDPPLEEVIAHIYGQDVVVSRGRNGDTVIAAASTRGSV